MDAVDILINQWQREGFEAEKLVAMETLGRIKRLEVIIMRKLMANYKENHNLSHWEFDVLATLRRAGSPYRLSPTELFDSMMVSSGTMTNRLQSLEKKELIRRVENLEDKRSLLVELSSDGLELINKAIVSHLKLENKLLEGLSKEEIDILNILLKKMEQQLN